ncbi:hypothetical protein FRC01_011754, partial [Tulasnella sp. 417]
MTPGTVIVTAPLADAEVEALAEVVLEALAAAEVDLAAVTAEEDDPDTDTGAVEAATLAAEQ